MYKKPKLVEMEKLAYSTRNEVNVAAFSFDK